MANLITLTIVITLFWLMHSLTEAIRKQRTSTNQSVLGHLGYDPEQHDLVVTLTDGSLLVGRVDICTGNPFQDGLILQDSRHDGENALPGAITFVAAGSITSLATRDRADK